MTSFSIEDQLISLFFVIHVIDISLSPFSNVNNLRRFDGAPWNRGLRLHRRSDASLSDSFRVGEGEMSRGCERGYRASKSFVSILSALDTVPFAVFGFFKSPDTRFPSPTFSFPPPPQLLPFPLRVAHFFPSFSVFIFFLFSSSPLFFILFPPPSQDRHKSSETHRSLSDTFRVET